MQTIQIRLTKELIKKAQEFVDRGLYSNKSEVIRDSLRRLVFKKELVLIQKRDFQVLFTSDIHGNIIQYKKLFQKAYSDNARAVIIGGDIAPKDSANRTIKCQRLFLKTKLFPIIKEFNEKNKKRRHFCSIFIILGNDDFKSNVLVLKQNSKKVGFTLIHNKCVKLHEDFKIIGYSYVPPTPFINKDWEKLDSSEKNDNLLRKDFLLQGRKARGNGFVDVKFNLNDRSDTIEKDIWKLLNNSIPEKTVLVTHAPPYNTNLDMSSRNIHVGSVAIKKLIKEKQPYITLHGHIHETGKVSGDFKQTIGKTVSISSCNDHRESSLSIICFNLYDPKSVVRKII